MIAISKIRLFAAYVLSSAILALPFWGGLQLARAFDEPWTPLQALVKHGATLPEVIKIGVVDTATVSQAGLFPQMNGFEHALIERFADFSGRVVSFVRFPNSKQMREALRTGQIDVAPVGFTSDESTEFRAIAVKTESNPWIIAYSPGTERPRGDADLIGKRVTVLPRVAASTMFAEVRARLHATEFDIYSRDDEEALLAEVDSARVRYALVDAQALTAMQHIYFGVGAGFVVHDTQRAWLTRASDVAISTEIAQFSGAIAQDRSFAALKDHYFGHTEAVNSFDATVFEQRIAEMLPKWKPQLKTAQDNNGMDWRLLASLAYQESQWQPSAVSYTGVWGFMQLTQDTANMYRVDRRDPTAAIAAGAKHLAYLHRATPDRIPEPDRSFLALAAYNVGLGHVEDARILAQRAKTNPDRWVDVKAQLPKLADPKIASATKFGYARGYEAVEYVDRIRAFYDIIARHEDAHAGRSKSRPKTLEANKREGDDKRVQTAMLSRQ